MVLEEATAATSPLVQQVKQGFALLDDIAVERIRDSVRRLIKI